MAKSLSKVPDICILEAVTVHYLQQHLCCIHAAVWRSDNGVGRTTTSGPVSTGISGTGNEYRPKCGDALRLGSKGRYGSSHFWMHEWVAGKTVWSLVHSCHTWAP